MEKSQQSGGKTFQPQKARTYVQKRKFVSGLGSGQTKKRKERKRLLKTRARKKARPPD